MYEKARGVTQDYKEAVKWYRKAAEQGNASAQNNLGVSYYYGRDLLLDYVMAYMWFIISAINSIFFTFDDCRVQQLNTIMIFCNHIYAIL